MKIVYAIVYSDWDGSYIKHICATREVADKLMVKYNYDPECHGIELWPVDE